MTTINDPRDLVLDRDVPPGPDGTLPFLFTCELMFSPTPAGSRYLVRAMHATVDAAAAHATMGFHDGWGAALDQLVALYRA